MKYVLVKHKSFPPLNSPVAFILIFLLKSDTYVSSSHLLKKKKIVSQKLKKKTL